MASVLAVMKEQLQDGRVMDRPSAVSLLRRQVSRKPKVSQSTAKFVTMVAATRGVLVRVVYTHSELIANS